MNNKFGWLTLMAILAILGAAPWCFAGSDRLIISMTLERMDQMDLVHVQFFSPDGTALESDKLKTMVIRELNCDSGHLFEIAKDYKIGYTPKRMLAGIYLLPQTWRNKTLCFNVPEVGKIEQRFNPATNNSRSFQLNMAPS